MRIPRIYTDQPLVSGTTTVLDGAPFHHLVRVLRLTEGAPVRLFNGREAGDFSCILGKTGKKQAEVSVGGLISLNNESPLFSHLGLVLSKGDRFEFALQKAVELGVNVITPLLSERCEVKLKGERAEKKMAQWSGVVAGACEQSYRTAVPEIRPVSSLHDWLKSEFSGLSVVLNPADGQRLSSFPRPDAVRLLIGPEGGLSEAEIQLAGERGFSGVLLGPRVLRTETAPLAVLSVMQALWGDI